MGDMADYENELIAQNIADAEEFLDDPNYDPEEALDRGFLQPDGSYSDELDNLIDEQYGPMSLRSINAEIAAYDNMPISPKTSHKASEYFGDRRLPEGVTHVKAIHNLKN